MYDIVIIGAGAAGCVAAIKAATSGARVVLIEKNAKIGRKLMLTGKGRCNITNLKRWSQFSTHLHSKPAFFKTAFYEFSNTDTVAFFESMGVETVLTRDDRVFPRSMQAATVVDALARALVRLKVTTLFSCDVNNVETNPDGTFVTRFVREDNRFLTPGAVESRAVIVATGGLSYPATGSTGAGYEIARSFGHTIKKTFPSLTALTPAGYDIRLKDITLYNISLSLFVGQDMVAFEFGDMQFTDGGIEGPVGFKVSRKAVWALMAGDKVTVAIDLKPAVQLDLLADRIRREAEQQGVTAANFKKTKYTFLRSYMPPQLVEPFADGNLLTLNNLAARLKDWRMPIADYVGYRRAVVTAGGVNIDEVISRTMGSRNRPGLFFAGEVLDIDGDTGGYNLQFAFSTGALAARGALEYTGIIR